MTPPARVLHETVHGVVDLGALRILLVDDGPSDYALVARAFQREPDVHLVEVTSEEALSRALNLGEFDAVVANYGLEWMDRLRLLQAVKARRPECPVIMLVETAEEQAAADDLRADDYLVKSAAHLARLPAAVRLTVELAAERKRAREAEAEARRLIERIGPLAAREAELTEAKTFLERLTAAGPGLLFHTDPHGYATTYISPNVERLLGYAPEEFVEKPNFWLEILHPEDRARLLTRDQRAAAGEGLVMSEQRIRHKDGSYRWFYVVVNLEYNEGGSLTGRLGYAYDVTDRKLAEEAMRQAREDAERANLAKSEFLSRMSHELRTPLNAILGFGQLLQMDTLSPEHRESVDQILKAGRHVLDLINEALDIARIEAGSLRLTLDPVRLSELVHESLTLVSPLAAYRSIHFDNMVGTDGPSVLADRQRLKQVLLNLLSNAVKYSRKGDRVSLSLHEVSRRRVRLHITDTGPGIPPDKMARLFTPFERIGAERTAVEGTGLGLTLSKRLVEAMQGGLGVDSTPGQGSTFWVELNLAEENAAETGDRGGQDGAFRTPVPLTGIRRTVLYIEDNPSNLRLVERIVSRRPEIRLVSAEQGRAGFDLARERHPDLILLDLNLPDIPGDTILQWLQDDPELQPIPVVVISADAAPHQVDRLLAMGARAYLTKPLDVQRLVTILNETLLGRGG